jgi:Ino eighty subunit 1
MRAQLRTYHAIPCLQARQDPHAYKQLQDAPRLKSILKGGSDDRPEPTSLDEIKGIDVPRTNPVNLLFLICQAAPKVAELHFPPPQEFHDLIMKTSYSSESRARAFLWLMWFYLESDFTEEGCEENPFGSGVDYGVDVANQGVPRLEPLTEEEAALENVDTQEEVDFGFAKQKMRAKIIEADQQFMAESQTKRGGGRGRGYPAGDEVGPTTGILPRIRPSKNESDLDSVRSTPPPRALGRQSGVFGSIGRRGPHSLKYQVFEGSSPGGDRILEGVVARKPRPPTAHQLAVERNRSQRVEYILDRGLRRSHHHARKQRRGEGAILRALPRLAHMHDPFDDSEDDETVAHGGGGGGGKHSSASMTNGGDNKRMRERGYGGLAQLKDEPDDFGEQVNSYASAFRRMVRRLERWENHDGPDLGVIQPVKRHKVNGTNNHNHSHGHGDEDDDEDDDEGDGEGEASPSKDMMIDPAETEDENEVMVHARRAQTGRGRGRANGGMHRVDTNGDTPMDDADDLDEVDKELLGLGDGDGDEGEGEGEGEAEGEDELDDVDKTLLGLDGDSDSE